MRKVVLVLTSILLSHAALGEKKIAEMDSAAIKKRVTYFFSFGMGAMIGCNQCESTGKVASFTSSAILGARIGKRLMLGTGLGFDSYENWKTMPLFASASWDLFGKRNKVFVQMNYGYSFATINNSEKGYGFKNERGGGMANPSLGYRITYGALSLSFSAGYRFQRVYSNFEYPTYNYPAMNIINPSYGPNSKETRIDMNRFVLGMTVGWK